MYFYKICVYFIATKDKLFDFLYRVWFGMNNDEYRSFNIIFGFLLRNRISKVEVGVHSKYNNNNQWQKTLNQKYTIRFFDFFHYCFLIIYDEYILFDYFLCQIILIVSFFTSFCKCGYFKNSDISFLYSKCLQIFGSKAEEASKIMGLECETEKGWTKRNSWQNCRSCILF